MADLLLNLLSSNQHMCCSWVCCVSGMHTQWCPGCSLRVRSSGSPGRVLEHTQAHQDIGGPQRQEDSFTEDKRRMQQGGEAF